MQAWELPSGLRLKVAGGCLPGEEGLWGGTLALSTRHFIGQAPQAQTRSSLLKATWAPFLAPSPSPPQSAVPLARGPPSRPGSAG